MFQVVLELLQGDKKSGQVAKTRVIHPNTAYKWKEQFLENGVEVFSQKAPSPSKNGTSPIWNSY